MKLDMKAAMFASRQMAWHNGVAARALGRLSSGKRLNKVADDPAGYLISERMRARLTGLRRAAGESKMQEGLAATREAGAGTAQALLRDMKALATAAAGGTVSHDDRLGMQAAMEQHRQALEQWRTGGQGIHARSWAMERQSLERMAGGVWRLGADGRMAQGLAQVAPEQQEDAVQALLKELDLTSQEGALRALRQIDAAAGLVSNEQTRLGLQSQGHARDSEHAEAMADILEEAEANMSDADMAKEMMDFVRGKAMGQIAGAMMVHAMKEPQKVVELLTAAEGGE